MGSDDTQKDRKVSIWLFYEDYNNFRILSGIKREWRPGYISKAGREAIYIWICYRELYGKQVDHILEIVQKKHPTLKTRRDLVRMGIKESVELFLKENEKL
jgi:hypothetical protein